MRLSSKAIFDKIFSSFLLIPGIEVVVAVFLGFIMPEVDAWLEKPLDQWFSWLALTPASGQAILSAIAGAMATVASIVFSVTTVTLSIATGQLGHRLLRTFVKSVSTQISLGAYVATSLYCLIVLVFVHKGGIAVPRLAILTAVLLAILDLGILVYFTHAIATLIQAPNIIKAVAGDLDESIETLYPEVKIAIPHEDVVPEDLITQALRKLPGDSADICSNQEGYIQEMRYEKIEKLALRYDATICLLRHPGHFLVREDSFARVWPKERCSERLARKINSNVVVGSRPTPRQDVEAAVQELVEVAVRALSPAVNDPFTAINCIDRLGATLSRLVRRKVPPPLRYDETGQLRLIIQVVSTPKVIDTAFNQLRQFGRGNIPVCIRLIETLAVIAQDCVRRQDLDALYAHAKIIYNRFEQSGDKEDRDMADLQKRFEHLEAVVHEKVALFRRMNSTS